MPCWSGCREAIPPAHAYVHPSIQAYIHTYIHTYVDIDMDRVRCRLPVPSISTEWVVPNPSRSVTSGQSGNLLDLQRCHLRQGVMKFPLSPIAHRQCGDFLTQSVCLLLQVVQLPEMMHEGKDCALLSGGADEVLPNLRKECEEDGAATQGQFALSANTCATEFPFGATDVFATFAHSFACSPFSFLPLILKCN